MQRSWGRLWRRISGWTLVLLGIAGCVLPVIPGIPLLLGGLALLSTEYAWAERTLDRLKRWLERARSARRPQPPPRN